GAGLAAMLLPDGVGLSWFWKVRKLLFCANVCRQSTTPNSIDKQNNTTVAAREARQPPTGGYALVAPAITRKPRSPRPLSPPSHTAIIHKQNRAPTCSHLAACESAEASEAKIAGKHRWTPYETGLGTRSPQTN